MPTLNINSGGRQEAGGTTPRSTGLATHLAAGKNSLLRLDRLGMSLGGTSHLTLLPTPPWPSGLRRSEQEGVSSILRRAWESFRLGLPGCMSTPGGLPLDSWTFLLHLILQTGSWTLLNPGVSRRTTQNACREIWVVGGVQAGSPWKAVEENITGEPVRRMSQSTKNGHFRTSFLKNKIHGQHL